MDNLLVLIGRPTGMEDVDRQARRHAPGAVSYSTISEALPIVDQSQLVIVYQQEPDEYSAGEISQLLDIAPLSRLMVCQGPWCASYGRARQHWPAAVCVDETRWLRRLEREFQILNGSLAPLPWTAGLDEIFAFDYGPAPTNEIIGAPTEN